LLTLFKANTEEELAKIKSMEVPVMEQAIKAYHQEGNLHPAGSVEVQITADPEFRELERMREIARHNEASALRHAREEGMERGMERERLEIARKMKNAGRPLNEITEFTGLTAETIKGI
jgi:predicted transposase/invertase (TIGR01784 family)